MPVARGGAYVTSRADGRTRFYGRYSHPSLDYELAGSDDDNSAGGYDTDPEDTHSITYSECTTSFSWVHEDLADGCYDDPRNYSLFHQKDTFASSRKVEKIILQSVTVVKNLITSKFNSLVAAATQDGLSHDLASAREEMSAVLAAHRMAITSAFADLREYIVTASTLDLSSTCRMLACRFCRPNGDILCRVGDMSRHVLVMSPTRLDVVSARVSKTTRHVVCSRHVGNFVIVV